MRVRWQLGFVRKGESKGKGKSKGEGEGES
jgi:hypothetical protein